MDPDLKPMFNLHVHQQQFVINVHLDREIVKRIETEAQQFQNFILNLAR